MIYFQTPLALLLVLPLLYLWWRLARGPRAVWPLRVAAVVLCGLMLASPVLRSDRRGRRTVFLVDRSLSVGREALDAAGEMVQLAQREKDARDRVSVATFGDGAHVTAGSEVGGELGAGSLDDASDLHAGLRLGGGLLSGSGGGRLVVLSDGVYTGSDPRAVVPQLRRSGVRVDFWPIRQERTRDAAITGVSTPERVPVGQPFEMSFVVDSPVACETSVRIDRPGRSISRRLQLEPGENRFAWRDVVERPGLVRYSLSVPVEKDGEPRNNRALAVTHVVGPPEVLVVNADGRPDNLVKALGASGLRVRLSGPGVDLSSAALKAFQTVVLEDVALSSLGDRSDAALRNYVTETGGGLLVTGGKNSFAAGGYYRSRLEPILPVSMERKEQYRRPALAMGIVLDRSGSMAAPVGAGLSKMDLANRAAAEAVQLLAPQDEVTVFAVDSRAHSVLELTGVEGNSGYIRDKILSIESSGGGIYVHNGLSAAVSELVDSDAPTRHIVLFADAADSEQPKGVAQLVEKWTDAGGTISVIGLGSEQDRDAGFLRGVAETGGGEVFFTTDPHALPRVFCEDTMRVARRTFLEQPTPARLSSGVHVLGRLELEGFPIVGGYNLCYRREEASLIARTEDEHTAPLAAAWQRGLGRVAALTCEADGQFSGGLRGWEHYQPFFSTTVRWLRRSRDDVSLFGSIRREGRTANVLLEMDGEAARRLRGAKAMIIPPAEGQPLEVPLHWVSGRRMEGSFKLGSNGVYHGVVLTRSGRRVSLPPVVLPYSPEFQRPAPGAGTEVLGEIARNTGGGRLMRVGELFEGTTGQAVEEGDAAGLAPVLAGMLLVILLCEIATRKALWGVLIPGRVRSAPGRAGRATWGWFRRVLTAARKRVTRGREGQPVGRDQAPTPEESEEGAEEEAQEETAEPEESVFERAKRRSRK